MLKRLQQGRMQNRAQIVPADMPTWVPELQMQQCTHPTCASLAVLPGTAPLTTRHIVQSPGRPPPLRPPGLHFWPSAVAARAGSHPASSGSHQVHIQQPKYLPGFLAAHPARAEGHPPDRARGAPHRGDGRAVCGVGTGHRPCPPTQPRHARLECWLKAVAPHHTFLPCSPSHNQTCCTSSWLCSSCSSPGLQGGQAGKQSIPGGKGRAEPCWTA